jgi:hypothetical protein
VMAGRASQPIAQLTVAPWRASGLGQSFGRGKTRPSDGRGIGRYPPADEREQTFDV